MCVAGLNVSTRPCSHRWYELRRACRSERNLSNCPDKLRLEGWENRSAGCPWCDGASACTVPITTHRLFGSVSSASGASSLSSPTSPELGAITTAMTTATMTRERRSGSGTTLGSLSRHGSTASSVGSERAQRQRELNDRFNIYLTAQPHEVLPSARKNYPSPRREEGRDSEGADGGGGGGAVGVFRGWRKSVKIGRAMFKG